MVYSVKEIFLTLQGEGHQSGRVAVFCRFSGCNLWNGREQDRSQAQCRFCDTDFVGTDGEGGGRFAHENALAHAIEACWGERSGRRYVVLTGGEPLLQVDLALIEALQEKGFEVAVETNGTLPVPQQIDWICVSPKGYTPLMQCSGHELKLVYPQESPQMEEVDPAFFLSLSFQHFWLQPQDGPNQQHNIERATAYCLNHPEWKLSLQTHKLIGIP
ncbi:7-carboxy-7-deazaguanine synthase [Entomobacter blattae]|uniref:7-carboxy-7-deazaguanine synthase n=1 Tax=Entomobacter blattae TaxID=2762277 RepID=A0A7H1NQF9_9PROT|nr:7-carboxy-7-deazaguanine synthase [Entomobacter blattae]QNT78019.1 7-carboxy-7-deazaguanine synthase [Entomobacter blattae]